MCIRDSLWPGRGVDADLETLGVNVVGQRLHVGELRVGMEHAVGVALAFPGCLLYTSGEGAGDRSHRKADRELAAIEVRGSGSCSPNLPL